MCAGVGREAAAAPQLGPRGVRHKRDDVSAGASPLRVILRTMDGLIAHCTPWNVSQSVLEPFAFTAEKQRVIHGMIEERVMQLIEEHVGIRLFVRETCLLIMNSSLSVQFASLLVDTGLGEIIDAWKTRQANVSGHLLYFIPEVHDVDR